MPIDKRAIVVGCGVSGLSSGIRLLEAGLRVVIWTRERPEDTTSAVAAAIWYPYRASPQDRVLGWARASHDEFLRLAEVAASGVSLLEGLEVFPGTAADPYWRAAVELFRRAGPAELPAGYGDGFVTRVPRVEMPVYLRYLVGRFEALGGRIVCRPLASLDEAFADAELVVNCSGLGSRELAPDPSVYAIRGQVVRVEGATVDRFLIDEQGSDRLTYIVPRSTDCVLGGTAEVGVESLEPDPRTLDEIVERCAALEPRLRGASRVGHAVGLRPARPEVRLELEQLSPRRRIVHNYGHGGAGVTLSWGCADEVRQLVTQHS